jgi:hypothetical protein
MAYLPKGITALLRVIPNFKLGKVTAVRSDNIPKHLVKQNPNNASYLSLLKSVQYSVSQYLCSRNSPYWPRVSSLWRLNNHIQFDTPHSVGLLYTSLSPRRMISPTQRPLPNSPQLSQETHTCPHRDSTPQPQRKRGATAPPLILITLHELRLN